MKFAFSIPVEMTAREELIGIYSDTYKDAYGIRPRWKNYDDMTDEEIEAGIEENCKIANENADAEAKYAAEQVEEFKALIDRYINEFGAGDEETALKWILDAEGEIYGLQCIEQIVWNRGILFTEYGRELVEKLAKVATFTEWES
jgi:hypothetical protein